ncbi:MAG TPA: hypothetical protein PK698_06405 [Bacilli bacterium]|nr:hypothetical protein [Bacilli bacterium]
MFKVIAKNDKFVWEELDGNGVAVAGSELFDTPEEVQADIDRVIAGRTPVDTGEEAPVTEPEVPGDANSTEPVEPGSEVSTEPLADPVPAEEKVEDIDQE